jgi:hypothetical protein
LFPRSCDGREGRPYEADYVTAREQVKVIEETARIKKCNFPDNPQSNAAII